MKDAIQVLDLSTLVFVVSSMLSLELSLTLRQILDPLRNPGFVGRVLLANFVLVPLVAYLLKTTGRKIAGYQTGVGTGNSTAQRCSRNGVETGNFSDDPNVLTMILVGSLLMLVILRAFAGEIGRALK